LSKYLALLAAFFSACQVICKNIWHCWSKKKNKKSEKGVAIKKKKV